MKVIVEVMVIDIRKGEAIFIPEHLVVGKVRQCKNFKRVYLYPSQEKLQRLIMAQYKKEKAMAGEAGGWIGILRR